MADLVVGLSKTAVQQLADKVKSAIKEEEEQWKIVQRDLVFITGEFEMMQSFLDTVSEEHVKNRIVRTWVHQVRDLSNDVEDSIDFILHINTTKRSSWWLRLVPSCGWAGWEVPPPPVDEAVAQTTLLRARVVDVSQRNIRYNLITDSTSKPMPAAMDPVQKKAASSFDVLINAVKKSGHLDLAELIGTKDRDLHVVSVCGTEADLGKVVIVRKAYSDARVSKEFEFRAWVKIMHPFNPQEFIKSLMTRFLMHSCQEQEDVIIGIDTLERMQKATQGDLIKGFAQKVNTHRYLIVVEDLCTMLEWDAVRSYLPDRKKGSRIVVLTHHPVVASQCTGEPCRVSELGQFSPGHSVRVYYKEGIQHDRVDSFIKAEPNHSLFSYDLLGRDTEIDELLEQTQKSQENRLISVWGMPGVGKSALVEAIYRKLRTCDEFKRHAWVSVSHPFNPTDFCRSLLVNLHKDSTSSEGDYAMAFRAEDPIKECRDQLRRCVCLFVIDGVQSHEDWDWIKSNLIQYGDSRSCIISITSEESVAKHCAVSIDGVYNIKGLDAMAANDLFEKALEEAELKEQEKKLLLSMCGGVPRVIITVARHLASNPSDVKKLRHLSNNFLHEFATNPEFDSLRDIQAWMYSYVHACPRHLKKYMLYLSIFPPHIIISRRRLIRRWIAEGYSKGTDSISKEKYAEKVFDEVAALSILQPVHEASTVIGYRVNGLFREYIMSRPVEETIFFPVEVSALENDHGRGRLTTEGLGQHLAIESIRYDDPVVFQSLDLSRLRSLTLFNSTFGSCYVLERMSVLRVLDLENARRVDDLVLEEIGKLPSRLKFLSLRGQREISRLPDSVGDLLQLQTLDIRDTSIVTLPPFITRLQKLQYIHAGTAIEWKDDAEEVSTPSSSRPRTLASCLPDKFLRRGPVGSRSGGGVVVVPRGIRRLQALQALGLVHAYTANGEGILDGIAKSFPQLRTLEISGISRKRQRYPLGSLYKLSHLESLTLRFRKNTHFSIFEGFYIPLTLRSLEMYGHVEKLPRHIKDYHNLVKLTLEMTTLFTPAVIQVLGSIPNLQTLRLRVNKDQDGELQFPSTEHFRKLQVLEIACKSKLHLTISAGATEKLELLKFHCLEGSEMLFSGLEHPVSLKQVWLLDSYDDALKEEVLQQLAKHPKKPAPKLEVQPRSSQAGSSATFVPRSHRDVVKNLWQSVAQAIQDD